MRKMNRREKKRQRNERKIERQADTKREMINMRDEREIKERRRESHKQKQTSISLSRPIPNLKLPFLVRVVLMALAQVLVRFWEE